MTAEKKNHHKGRPEGIKREAYASRMSVELLEKLRAISKQKGVPMVLLVERACKAMYT